MAADEDGLQSVPGLLYAPPDGAVRPGEGAPEVPAQAEAPSDESFVLAAVAALDEG